MKTINRGKDTDQYSDYFQSLIHQKDVIVVWHLDRRTEKRTVHKAYIEKIQSDKNSMQLNVIGDESFLFKADFLYFYVECNQFIFKSKQLACDGGILFIESPEELKILDEHENNSMVGVFDEMGFEIGSKKKGYEFESGSTLKKESPYMALDVKRDKIETKLKGQVNQSARDKDIFETELSFVTLDEEDKKFDGQRTAPRARPPEGKKIWVSQNENSDEQSVYPLFDLSRGGLGLLSKNKEEFAKDQLVYIFGFDENKLDQPMVAQVKSIREADKQGLQFKIGMQFI